MYIPNGELYVRILIICYNTLTSLRGICFLWSAAVKKNPDLLLPGLDLHKPAEIKGFNVSRKSPELDDFIFIEQHMFAIIDFPGG